MNQERVIWAAARLAMESSQKKNRRNGSSGIRYWASFEKVLGLFVWTLRLMGLHKKGLQNAINIQCNKVEISFDQLPKNFNMFRILHLSDLHIDGNPFMLEPLIKEISKHEFDICLITGDFRFNTHGKISGVIDPLKKLLEAIDAPMGVYATLGNHDSQAMVPVFEEMGIHMLVNESVKIKKGNDEIVLTGIDDVHYYYTDHAIHAMEQSPEGFKIALVHSPEMFDIAAENNYMLYLCGHTHAGQICLPSGKPVFKHLYTGKNLTKGLWKYNQLTGYTSAGCGTSGIPVRFNCKGEITLFTLLK
jgi:uncharacterized protein